MATPNIEAIKSAAERITQMHRAIKLFEAGEIKQGEFTFPLTAANVAAIKSEFAADRTACIALLNSITAS
jgi:hypothetical protein